MPEFEVIEESMPNCRSSEISAVDTSNARKAIPAVPLESAQSQEDVDSNIPTALTRLSANTPANVNSSDYSRSSGNQFSTRSQQVRFSLCFSRECVAKLLYLRLESLLVRAEEVPARYGRGRLLAMKATITRTIGRQVFLYERTVHGLLIAFELGSFNEEPCRECNTTTVLSRLCFGNL